MSSNHSSLTRGAAARPAQDDFRDEWLRPKEAAAYIKSSESTLAKKRLKGNGPTYTKFGRLVLYAKRDLDEFLASHRRLSTSDTSVEAA